MLSKLKHELNRYPDLKTFLRSPIRTTWNWVYAAYLTLRYVDQYEVFPAFQFRGSMCVKISKNRKATVIIKDRLIFEQWLNGDGRTTLILGENAKLIVEREFVLGNGIKVSIGNNAQLILKGKEKESASGITANSVVMVNEYLEIGKDCLIAWDNFITDCDWHGIDGKESTKKTIIGDHVWLGVGVKILKGANVGKNSIVTTLSVVLKGEYPENALVSGNPAAVIKTGIAGWHREMAV